MNEMEQNYLAHHGILGQKWGIRRYQNSDGSLTDAGRKRYGIEGERTAKQTTKRLNDLDQAISYNRRDASDSYKVISKLEAKAAKRSQKGKERLLTKRQEKKLIKNFKKNLDANEYIKQGEEETKKILSSIPDNMNLRSYVVPRDVTKETERLLFLMANTFYSKTVPGIEYKVTNKSKKQLEREAAEREKR